LKDKAASTVASHLFRIFCDFGFPKILQSDNGTEFCNSVINSLASFCYIDKRTISAYHPRANGLAERHVRTVKTTLGKLLDNQISLWTSYLCTVQLMININVHSLFNSAPFSVMFARSFNGFKSFETAEHIPLSEEDLASRIQHAQQIIFPAVSEKTLLEQNKISTRFNKTNKIVQQTFLPGEMVLVKLPDGQRSSLYGFYEGPYTVVRRNKGNAYILRDSNGLEFTRKFPPSLLKPFHTSDSSLNAPAFPVEKILGHKGPANNRLYHVKWQHYDDLHNTWEPVSSFHGTSLINDYWKAQSQASK
jgi:hypothetical protein